MRLLLILSISSTVSCSLHYMYNEIKLDSGVTVHVRKKTEHLSTLGEKQSKHFAVLSYEGFYVLDPVSSIVN